MGEVYRTEDGSERFSSGISRYPYLGAVAHRIRTGDLAKIYDGGKRDSCVIGKLTQDDTIGAAINIPQMLAKHFAVVGSTGVGKTTAVTLLLNKAIETDPKLRVLILDPHNEFAAAFPDHSVVIDTDTLDLPFWLMRLEEFAEVIFRGRKPVPEEMDVLREIIPEAKRHFAAQMAPPCAAQRTRARSRRIRRFLTAWPTSWPLSTSVSDGWKGAGKNRYCVPEGSHPLGHQRHAL